VVGARSPGAAEAEPPTISDASKRVTARFLRMVLQASGSEYRKYGTRFESDTEGSTEDLFPIVNASAVSGRLTRSNRGTQAGQVM
jgi:hypothetical protein